VPLFSISKANLTQYREKLSPGQIALMEKIPGYRMDVYPTRRTAGYPAEFYERTQRNLDLAKLDEKSDILTGIGGGFLFPRPTNGIQAIWNNRLRYYGTGYISHELSADVSVEGRFTPSVNRYSTYAPFHDFALKDFAAYEDVYAYQYSETISPARLVGDLALYKERINSLAEAWIYSAGQRRVRRSPSYNYDSPASEGGLMTIDQVFGLTGRPDRYDWTLKGKQEMYIPYNTYKLTDPRVDAKEVIKPGAPSRDLVRYELHRVWQVEGTVKAGMRHLLPKRVLFLDEDSWLCLVADYYDARGEITRVVESSMIQATELPAPIVQASWSMDLPSGRYFILGLPALGKEYDLLALKEGRTSAGLFTPTELRARGQR
jgi:Protein of unknown function (DUF1329)